MKKVLGVLLVLLCSSLVSQAASLWRWTADENITNSPLTSDWGSQILPYWFSYSNSQHMIAAPSATEFPIHVVWGKKPLDDSDYYRLYHKSKTLSGWSDETLLTPAPLHLHNQFPSFSVATNSTGNFVCVVWIEESRNINGNILGQVYTKTSNDYGQSWSGPVQITIFEVNHFCYMPDVAIGNDGNIFFTWHQGWLWTNYKIGFAHYQYNAELDQLTQIKYYDQIDPTSDIHGGIIPSIAVDPNGYYVHITWLQELSSNSSLRILYRNYNIQSESLGSISEIISQPGLQTEQMDPPSISCSQNGTPYVHIMWSYDATNSGSFARDIYYKRSTDNGSTWSNQTLLSSNSSDNIVSGCPTISVSGANSNIIDLFYNEHDKTNIDPNYNKLYWRRSTNAGLSWGNITLVPTSSYYNNSGSVSTGHNNTANFIIQSTRDNNLELYYKKYYLNNTPDYSDRGINQNPAVTNIKSKISISPNPVKSLTNITLYTNNGETPFENIQIYNIQGRLVRNLKINNLNNIIWDGTDNNSKKLPSGVYILRASNNGIEVSARVMLVK
ncbi:TPA: hypothetical protein DCG35_06690 [Candidatus Edwardsbacteria bacterium]|nr:hypothetical protein [Candidatus Edwardsbacteria bacterium]HBZ87618.1 hypothetical protein [Candidatus Edwardsbacteria bacterium]